MRERMCLSRVYENENEKDCVSDCVAALSYSYVYEHSQSILQEMRRRETRRRMEKKMKRMIFFDVERKGTRKIKEGIFWSGELWMMLLRPE